MHYYTRDIGRFICKTIALSMLEEGAYGRLLDQLYNTERPLTTDREMLYRLARAQSTAERTAVDEVIERLFTLTENGYVERDVLRDIAACCEKRVKASRSAEARRNKRLVKNGEGADWPCKTDAHHTPVSNIQKPVNAITQKPYPETRSGKDLLDGNGVAGGRFEEENASPSPPTLRQLADAIRQRNSRDGGRH
jgi:uncharacterized protein YdaU (DUF1376 family)